MKIKLQKAVILAGFMAFTAIADESDPSAQTFTPPDKHKVSYALGMRLGLQIKQAGVDVDVNEISQAVKDVLDGKPTKIQNTEKQAIFAQAKTAEHAKIAAKNDAEGKAYCAKNAKLPGVTVLPDGLQYKVVEAGTGELPKTNDAVVIKFRGGFVDGKDFDVNDHYWTPVDRMSKGLQEAVQLMKVGSKWQLVVPPELAFGYEGTRMIDPDMTLVYDLELISIEPAKIEAPPPAK